MQRHEIMSFKGICQEIFSVCNYADEPTHTNREAEYRKAFAGVWMAHKIGAITDAQYMQLHRDVCDQYYMYSKDDHKELAKANQGNLEV